MATHLEDVAVCILGERVGNQAPLILLACEALTGVAVRIVGPNGGTLEAVHVGDVAAYSMTRRVLNLRPGGGYVVSAEGYEVGLGPYVFPSVDKTRHFGVVCCDADWQLPIRGTWRDLERVNKISTVFHIGDQVYHMNFLRTVPGQEHRYMQHARRIFVSNYIRTWSAPHKRSVLAERHNVMIGDDHEVTDDAWMALPNAGRPEFESLKEVAISVYRNIQGGLRFDPRSARNDFHSTVIGTTLFIMMGRMYNMVHSVDDYVTFIGALLSDKATMEKVQTVVVLMTRPPLNRDRLVPCMSRPRQHDFAPLYRQLFHARDEMDKKVVLVGGDLHVLQRWRISARSSKLVAPLTLTSIPSIASCVPTPYVAVNAGIPPDCEFVAQRRERARVNGFGIIDVATGQVRCVTRRYVQYYVWNDLYTGAKDLWSRWTTQRLEAE